MKIVKLGEIADVYSGQIMSRVKAGDIERTGDYISSRTMKVIVPKSITSDGLIDLKDIAEEKIIVTDCKIVENNNGAAEFESVLPIDNRRVTSLGDIVIKLSAPFDSATITAETSGFLVPSFCAIIRNKSKLNSDYLQAFLNSDLCKEQLREKVAGAIITILSVGKIKDIEIPVPDAEQQRIIGTRYRETQRNIATFKKIAELEKKRNDILFLNMVK